MVINGNVEVTVCLSLDAWENIHGALEFYDSNATCELAATIREQVRNGIPYSDNWYDKE